MKHLILTLCSLLAISASHAAESQAPDAPGRWTAEKAKQWYDSQPWPCGFNYVPAHAISYTEMWMPYNFDPAKMNKELALAEEVGFNCLRVVLPFVVWEHDPAAFKKRLDEFLEVCDRRGLRVMFSLFDDCGEITNPQYGRQPEVVKGWYANAWSSSPGHDMVRDPETWPRLEKYFREGCLPLFAAENVGCMHWGLVNGRSQTHLRWGARPGQPEPEVWQCDLFHGDHTPYARAEIDLFKKTIATSRK